LLDPKRLFQGLEFEERFRFTASDEWVLDCLIPGPPPVAVELLSRRSGGHFYEKVVKLQDLRRAMDCRTVIITGFAPSQGQIRLCTAAGISIVLARDAEGVRLALGGTSCEEANRRAILHILKSHDRVRSAKCREGLLAAFRDDWLTLGEAKSRLRWSYSEEDVAAQVRSLLASGKIALLARSRDGSGIYGVRGRSYAPRDDLSERCRKEASRQAVKEVLAKHTGGMTSSEVAEACRMPVERARICLRDLSKRSKVAKEGTLWRLGPQKAP